MTSNKITCYCGEVLTIPEEMFEFTETTHTLNHGDGCGMSIVIGDNGVPRLWTPPRIAALIVKDSYGGVDYAAPANKRVSTVLSDEEMGK